MPNSNIRTIAIRFSLTEHRLLDDLAAAHGVDIETLIREALTFGAIEAESEAPRLRVLGGGQASASQAGVGPDRVLPGA